MVLAILIRAEIKGVLVLKIMEKATQMIPLAKNKMQKYGMKCTRLVQIPKRRTLNWIVDVPLSTSLGTLEALEQGLWNLEGLRRLLQQPNVKYVRQMVYEIRVWYKRSQITLTKIRSYMIQKGKWSGVWNTCSLRLIRHQH